MEHTIEWSREQFEGLFTSGPQDVQAFLADETKFFKDLTNRGNANEQMNCLRTIMDLFMAKKDNDFRVLVAKARELFQDYY